MNEAAPTELVVYKFTVKGRYPDGSKVRMQGMITAPDGFPSSAFDAAVAACKEMAPDLNVDMTKSGQVVLAKKKGRKV